MALASAPAARSSPVMRCPHGCVSCWAPDQKKKHAINAAPTPSIPCAMQHKLRSVVGKVCQGAVHVGVRTQARPHTCTPRRPQLQLLKLCNNRILLMLFQRTLESR